MTNPVKLAFAAQRTHYHATCWKVERADGTVTLYVTDHDTSLDVVESNASYYQGGSTIQTFSPASGFIPTARQFSGQLKDQNAELLGLIAAAAITTNDLWAGHWRDAKITEYLVDWRFPWAGPLRTRVYWVDDVEFDSENWVAQVSGLSRWLKQSVGRRYSKFCDAELGDSRCGKDISAWTAVGCTVKLVDADEPRRKFTCTTAGNANLATTNRYRDGRCEWTAGDNDDVTAQIKVQDNYRFLSPDNVVDIELWLPAPFDISVGDVCTLYPGCDKLPGHSDTGGDCKNTYDNLVNFRGFQFVPGNDRMLQGP